MANKERRERLFGMAHVLAMWAIERLLGERQTFITSEVEEIRRELTRDYGHDYMTDSFWSWLR